MSTRFRLNCRCVFFTYSRCDLTRDELLAFFVDKFKVKDYVICIENHKHSGDDIYVPGEDRGPSTHLHAVVVFENKLDVKNPRVFDIGDYHPNFGPVRDRKHAVAYVLKEDETPIQSPGILLVNDSLWDAMLLCKRWKDVLTLAIEHGGSWIKVYGKEKSAMRSLYNEVKMSKVKRVEAKALETFDSPMIEQINELIHAPGRRPPVIWIQGETGVGKTELVRTLAGPGYIRVTTKDQLKDIDYDDDTVLCFDDFDWSFLSAAQIIQIYDNIEPVRIDCKYHDAVVEPCLKFITHNHGVDEVNFPRHSGIQLDAILRRVNMFYVKSKIYKE